MKTLDSQNQKPPHSPWVGVAASLLLLHGLGIFLAGNRASGIRWFFGLCFLGFLALMLATIPVTGALWVAMGTLVSLYGLWLVMLRRSYRPIPRFKWWTWLVLIVGCLLVDQLRLQSAFRLFGAFTVPTRAMAPTIEGDRTLPNGAKIGGDRLFVQKYVYWFRAPARGEVVVFQATHLDIPERMKASSYVKRVVGVPGDKLRIKDGHVFVNENPLSDPPIFGHLHYICMPSSHYLVDESATYVVPTGSCFVLGDNSASSADSRYWGCVPMGDIVGRAVNIYWPPARFGVIR